MGSASALTLDVSGGKIYWLTFDSIRRANLDGTGVETLVTGMNGIRGLALGGGMIYWTRVQGLIQRANLDGTGVEDVVTISRGAFGLAVDEGEGMIYWSTEGKGRDGDIGQIQRANLDGSGVEDLEGPVTYFSSDLALDPGEGKIYYVDRGLIQRANLDGTGVERLIQTQTTYIALDIFGQ